MPKKACPVITRLLTAAAIVSLASTSLAQTSTEVATPSPVPVKFEIPTDVIDQVKARVDNGYDSGIAIAMYTKNGEASYVYGNGRPGEPLKIDAIFEIGSISKAFTGAILADLVQSKEVRLDDPLSQYLPEGSKVPEKGGKKITLEALANHKSGLPRLPDNLAPANPQDPYADYSEKNLLDFLASYQLTREPGEAYEYSNLGAGILGHVLARSQKTTWGALVKARIIDPLGLKDTTVTLTDEQKKRLVPGHVGDTETANWNFDALAGAGALKSTVGDLLIFAKASAGIIPTPVEESLRMAWETVQETGTYGTKIGLGWHMTSTVGGVTVVWHNGGTGGYRSFVGFVPRVNKAVAVISNSSSEVDSIGMHLLDPTTKLPEVSKRSVVALSEAELKRLEGAYELAAGVILDVRAENGKLTAQMTGQQRFDVFPTSATEFFYKVVEAKLSFEMGKDGNAEKVTLKQNGQEMPALKTDKLPATSTPPVVTLSEAELKRLEGAYELVPGATLDVRVEGGKLTAQLTGQQRFEVFPTSPTEFYYKVVEAKLAFELDKDGSAEKVTLKQNGREMPALKKK